MSILAQSCWALQTPSGKKAVDDTYRDHDVIFAFGRYLVSNRGPVFRVRDGVPLSRYDRAVFYIPKVPKGYVDYPHRQQYIHAAAKVQTL